MSDFTEQVPSIESPPVSSQDTPTVSDNRLGTKFVTAKDIVTLDPSRRFSNEDLAKLNQEWTDTVLRPYRDNMATLVYVQDDENGEVHAD